MNKVVAHFLDGRLVKGTTADFTPGQDHFSVEPSESTEGQAAVEIETSTLKALFFVKDYAGDPTYVYRNVFDPNQPPVGDLLRVDFKDGEVIVGTTSAYDPEAVGFLLVPADVESNVVQCYVMVAATTSIKVF